MKNPFRYGSRVTGGAFFDRERIIRDMLDVIDGGNNIVLYGPRRYGKSPADPLLAYHLASK